MLNIDLKKEAYLIAINGLKQRNKYNSEFEMDLIDYVFNEIRMITKIEEFSIDECLRISQGIDEALNLYES